jgi:hypothetical protein
VTPLVLTGTARTQYALIITPPEEPLGNDPRRKRLLEITVHLLVLVSAMIAFAPAEALAHYFVSRNPVAAIENDDIGRDSRSGGVFDKCAEQVIQVSKRQGALLEGSKDGLEYFVLGNIRGDGVRDAHGPSCPPSESV